MTDPAEVIAKALREANAPADSPTRLATVTAGSVGVVNVRFDGETLASARSYQHIYAPARVGDRVVMLRVGSTWIALCRLPSTADAYDSGWITPTLMNSWVHYSTTLQYRRMNGVTYLRGTTRNGTQFAPAFNLPAGFRPGQDLRIANWGAATATNVSGIYIQTNGDVTPYWNTLGTGGEHSIDGIAFPADG